MEQVTKARTMVEQDARIALYQKLEEQIVQEDCAWIPLCLEDHLFVVSPDVSGFTVLWNGWGDNFYKNVSVSR